MKKILFIVDKEGWAYDDAAKNWKNLLAKEYDCDILYLENFSTLGITHSLHKFIKNVQNSIITNTTINLEKINNIENFYNNAEIEIKPLFNYKDYDGFYFFYHRALCDSRLLATTIPLNKVAVAINNEKWLKEGVTETFETYLKDCKVISYCNKFIYQNFKQTNANLLRVSQSINEQVFNITREKTSSNRVGREFTVGWSGNPNNKEKNFELVYNACKKANIKFSYKKDLNREQLNEWYNSIDCVVCTSFSEGGPLMLLEAGACALPVITVPVGLAREIIVHEKTGLIIDWAQESVIGAIKRLSNDRRLRANLGRSLQKVIIRNWTYTARLNEIKKVLASITE